MPFDGRRIILFVARRLAESRPASTSAACRSTSRTPRSFHLGLEVHLLELVTWVGGPHDRRQLSMRNWSSRVIVNANCALQSRPGVRLRAVWSACE